MNRPLPPFGRSVLGHLRRGETLNLWVYGGRRGWEEARWCNKHIGAGSAMLLPPGDDPDEYTWPVYSLELMLVWLDGSFEKLEQHATVAQLSRFDEILVRNGASLVVAPCATDLEGFLFFRPQPLESVAT